MQNVSVALSKTGTTSTHLWQAGVAGRVVCRLRRDQCLGHRDITCVFYDGVLILRGSLPTFYLKQLAQTLAAQVEGVHQIDNRIEVSSLPRIAVPLASS
jgi:osmotically-inducible protein OsmY